MTFNIAISNTDDHLRNHGFILQPNGWMLSPAYDLNPSIDKDHLALNIDLDNSELDIHLALSVGSFFRLNTQQMNEIITDINAAIVQWESIAKNAGIARKEIEMMRAAFREL
jgi:serine/threonine-protein kinase HipA